jgi:hypothetical protein
MSYLITEFFIQTKLIMCFLVILAALIVPVAVAFSLIWSFFITNLLCQRLNHSSSGKNVVT